MYYHIASCNYIVCISQESISIFPGNILTYDYIKCIMQETFSEREVMIYDFRVRNYIICVLSENIAPCNDIYHLPLI